MEVVEGFEGDQMPEEDLVELKFRLYDGSDIGPFRYSSSSTVGMLKERIICEWPKGGSFDSSQCLDFRLSMFSFGDTMYDYCVHRSN